jgi:hypothetical protein
MSYAYLRFFNIEYWYCVISSWFGEGCASSDFSASGAPAPAPSGGAGFWDWLFGVHSTGAGGGGLVGEGLYGAIENAVIAIGGAFGGILGILWGAMSVLSFFLSFLLLLGIIGCALGIIFIRKSEERRYSNLPPAEERSHPLRNPWQALIAGAMSQNPKEWRESILGADRLMGDLLARLGFPGADTAERIQRIPEGSFANLPAAWEAHRIRNLVANPSSHFILTQREAFRVMKLYEQVFREFDFI